MPKILVGDDDLVFARKSMPYIPQAEIEFVDTFEAVIRRAACEEFDIVITDLNYTPGGQEGFLVLDALRGSLTRRILWTGDARDPAVRARAMGLGAEVLDKDELGTLVGMAVSEAPLKTDGLVLIYVSDLVAGPNKALKQVVETLFNPGQVVVGTDLKAELLTGLYGLVVDTTALEFKRQSDEARPHGRVAHDLKYLELPAVPRVVCVHQPSSVIADIAKAVSRFLAAGGRDLEPFG